MGLGSYPDIQLAEARDRASKYRILAKSGIDPIEARLPQTPKTPNFTTCAAGFIRSQRQTWQNKKHARQWVIPAVRTKTRKEHRVPLSQAAFEILNNLPNVDGNSHVFPGLKPGRPLSNMTLLKVMRGMGYGVDGDRGAYVPHGFRSSFRDWAGETTNFPRDVVEMALAHTIENKVEAAYRRGDLFAKRRELMEAWANYIVL